ncbi:MAG: hypothetical protein ACJ74C_07805 [Gaiellaceae bacterium]
MTARRVVSLLCAAVCATALVGCGGDTLSFDPVAQAANQTAKSESSRVAFSANVQIDGVGGMSMSGSGVFDGRARSGAMNMRFALPGGMASMFGGADPSMEMIVDGRKGLVMYMRSPLFKTMAGTRWLKLDMAKLAQKQGFDLNSMMNANQADPSQSLHMLMASSDAHAIGYDRVRGVFTTHYTLKVDLARLAKGNDEYDEMVEQLKQMSGATSFPAEAWIDDKGRVRRMKIDMSLNSPTGGAVTMSMTMDLYAFGIKVDVPPPAASDVVDLSTLLGG